MRRPVYRSLDQKATFFGIRGRFLLVAGLGAGIALILGTVAGAVAGMLPGIGTGTLACAGAYLATVSLQSRVDEKDLWKVIARRGYPHIYWVRPKHIRNLWQGFNLAPRLRESD